MDDANFRESCEEGVGWGWYEVKYTIDHNFLHCSFQPSYPPRFSLEIKPQECSFTIHL